MSKVQRHMESFLIIQNHKLFLNLVRLSKIKESFHIMNLKQKNFFQIFTFLLRFLTSA